MAHNEVFNKDHNDSTDIWDDTALIKMYEDSIRPSLPQSRTWNVGDKCVAQYAEDQLWYKGTITKISGTIALVLFDGYEEEPEAEVELSELADHIENEEEESNTENGEITNTSQTYNLPSNVHENPLGSAFGMNGQNFLPPFAPPPPPMFKNLTQPDEIEALSSMLMSWYMSGYHTGCYVTMMDHSGIGNDPIITLISADHQKVVIEAKALEKSLTLSQLYENIAMDSMEIPLSKITYSTLQKVVLWLNHSYGVDYKNSLKIKEDTATPDLPPWDRAFFNKLNNTELLALVQAAEYLLIEELLEMGCRVIAKKLREGKSIPKIREEWDVNPGWTKEEEAQIKRDLRWCYNP